MRVSRRGLLLLIAGIIAAFTAISVRNRLAEAPVATQTAPSNRVIIAKHDLAPGTFVQGAQDLDWGVAAGPFASNAGNETPETYLHEGAARLDDFNGAVVRREVHAGEPVAQSALMKSGEGGFMSAVLDPGMRAVSIAVTATSGNAGFVSPGDRIDLIVTHRIKAPQGSNGEDTIVSETFIHKARVVAVDQMLDNPDNKAILAKTVTVEVSPREAEEIAVAEELGKISVALRSLVSADTKKAAQGNSGTAPAVTPKNPITDLYGPDSGKDNGQAADSDYTRDRDISEILGQRGIVSSRVHVIRGDQSENLQF